MAKPFQRLIVSSALVAVLGVLSACGASSTATAPLAATATATEPTAAQDTSAATLPPCANAGTPIALPSDFPATFPLPPGSVITQQEARDQGRVITVLSPGDAHTVAAFFERELAAKSFKTADGESEADEAEEAWAGAGYQGRWKARNIDGCAGAVTLTIFASK